MSTQHQIHIDGNYYKYSLTALDGGLILFDCPAAGISQRFDSEDLVGTLLNLPDWIQEHQAEITPKHQIKINISNNEQNFLEKISREKGFSDTSEYIKSQVLVAA